MHITKTHFSVAALCIHYSLSGFGILQSKSSHVLFCKTAIQMHWTGSRPSFSVSLSAMQWLTPYFCSSTLWALRNRLCPPSCCSAPVLNVTKTVRPCSALLHQCIHWIFRSVNLLPKVVSKALHYTIQCLSKHETQWKAQKSFQKKPPEMVIFMSFNFEVPSRGSILNLIASSWLPLRETLWTLEHVVYQSVT